MARYTMDRCEMPRTVAAGLGMAALDGGEISTPFIAKWPAIIKDGGGITRQMGHFVDLMATLLDSAGTEHPTTYEGGDILPMEGKSLLPVFEGRTHRRHDVLCWEHEGNRIKNNGNERRICSMHRYVLAAFISLSLLIMTACAQPVDQNDADARKAAQDTRNFMEYFKAMNPDMVMERVVIPPNGIPAFYIYMKAKENDLKPGVIMVHGHGADKRYLFSLNWPRDLAYMGYAVLAIDAWGHGERPSVPECLELQKASWFDSTTKAIQKTIQEMPTVYDYLAAQPHVDPKHIGLMGVSMGGCITIGTAVIEDRIAAYVPVSAGLDYINWFADSKIFPGGDQLPDTVNARIHEFDPIYFPEKIAGKPVRFIHGLNDPIVPAEYAKRFYETLRPLYEKCPERLDWRVHNAFPFLQGREPQPRELVVAHFTSQGMTQDAFDWLDTFLKKQQE